jgi:hypothetical protein
MHNQLLEIDMQHGTRHAGLATAMATASAIALAIAGCGGGGGSGGGGTSGDPTTIGVPVTVIDGAIENATVCLDKNNNGVCDTGEPTGRTNAAGKVTLQVDAADSGRFPIVAVVGTDARDADTGAVPVAFTMKAPADKPAVVSPLTTLVQSAMDSSGKSSTEAEAVVRSQAGLNVSLFNDYTAAADADNVFAGTVARLVVLTVQKHSTRLSASVGAVALDGSTITRAHVNRAIQNAVSQNLSTLAAKAADASVLGAAAGAAREAALQTQADAVVADTALTPTSIKTVVAVENQVANPVVEAPATPVAGFTLANLSYTDASNHYARYFTASAAQNTPDANNTYRYVERHVRTTAGNVAKWTGGNSNNPQSNADLSWNGSAWVACPLNFEDTSTARDAQGKSSYDYCNKRSTGTTQRAVLDIAGKTMAEVYAQVREGGYANLYIADPSLLGDATFPAGSRLQYTIGTTLTTNIGYYPGRSFLPDNGNTVGVYGAAATAGGDTRSGPVAGCSSPGAAVEATTLEMVISAKPGTPCIYGQQTFNYGGVTYRSDVPSEGWGITSISLGTVGTAPFNAGAAPGYYTGNTRLRAAFKGSGANAVTYYACKERFNDGSTRNCREVGAGTYTIETLGDARVMGFNNLPPQAAALGFTRVFVERGGAVYFGYRSKQGVNNSARLNTTAGTALLNQLGMTPEDPSTPVVLTAGSYQGTWDVKDPIEPAGSGTTIFIQANGTSSCQSTFNTADTWTCTVVITNPATGAFSLTDTSGGSATGSFNFLAGTGTGAYSDPTATPASGNFVASRR